MNCYQRQAMVMLEKNAMPVTYLLSEALISSDLVLKDVICSKERKYNFESNFFNSEDLACIGAEYIEHSYDSFADVEPIIRDTLALNNPEPFAILPGDVFYFDHCPEFRKIHLQHVVTVVGFDDSINSWNIVDDNEGSILCDYQYDNQQVADFFENCGFRNLITFNLSSDVDQANVAAEFENKFASKLSNHEDSYLLFDQIIDIIDDPFSSKEKIYEGLGDALSLLSGSRSCVAQYLKTSSSWRVSEELANDYASLAEVIKGMFLKASITDRIDRKGVYERCQRLKAMDREMLRCFS